MARFGSGKPWPAVGFLETSLIVIGALEEAPGQSGFSHEVGVHHKPVLLTPPKARLGTPAQEDPLGKQVS